MISRDDRERLREILATYSTLVCNHTKSTDDIPALLAATDRALRLIYESRIRRML